MRRTTLQILGDTIRQLRRDAGMTQEDLAEAAEVHANYIGMIENGHRNPSVINLLFIARALRVHPGRLFEDLNDRDMARLPKKRARRLRTGK